MGLSLDFNPHIAFVKILSLALALCLVVPFTPDVSQTLLLVTSYGHFALAHFYQWKKEPPSKRSLLALALIFAGCWLFYMNVPAWPTVILLTLFFFHCFWDEFKIQGEETNILSGALIFTMVSTQVLWLMERFGLQMDRYIINWFLISGFSLLALCVYLYTRNKLHLTTNIILFSLVHIAFIIFFSAGIAMTALLVFRVVIHFHGISWYIHVGQKYWKTHKGWFWSYIRNVLIVNGIFIGGYFLYRLFPEHLAILQHAFYSVAGYFGWGMIHLITTFRPDDYRNILSWPKALTKT